MLHGVAALVCLAVFLFGLFPVSPRVAVAERDGEDRHEAAVGRVVWVVIDGLRGDFPLLPLAGVSGVAYTDCAAPAPTVTLPRLFALVTGSEPSFVQALSNFGGGGRVEEDSLVRRWRRAGKRLVFFGDDTWLRLFPASVWERSEGVTSFAVRDTVEVDANVTRNIRRELKSDAWDVMVLHFLGLDHVGHSLGPQHPRLGEKLGEMRAVIAEIAASLGANDLIVVSGDHGMTAEGNHGGGSRAETSTQQLFLRPDKGRSATVARSSAPCHQADVSATLAELSGVAAPANCLGEPLLEAIAALGGNSDAAAGRSDRRLRHWARQVGSEFVSASQLRRLGEAQLSHLLLGMAGIAVALLNVLPGDKWVVVSPIVGVCVAVMAGAVLQLEGWAKWLVLMYAASYMVVPKRLTVALSFESICTALVLVWNFSSSFAEESHLAFAYVAQSVCLLRGNWIALLLLRASRELNPGGDKWRLLVRPLCQQLALPTAFSCFFPVVVVGIVRSVWILPLANVVSFHAAFASVWLARICLAIALMTAILRRNRRDELSAVVALLVQLVHQANGVCHVAAVALCFAACWAVRDSNWQLRLMGHVWAGALGLSLSVASIPLSGAYTFVGQGYHEAAVFATGFVTVAGPQLIAASFVRWRRGGEKESDMAWSVGRALVCCVSAFLQRRHLFVWSVFGPMVAWQAVDLAVTNVRFALLKRKL
jgi:hypothetical protein